MSQALFDVLVGIALLVGIVGIVVPVLPGTVLVAVALLVWAAATGGVWAWSVLAIGLLLLGLGQVLKYLLPGRSMTAAGIPGRTLVIGGLAGIAGFFLLPPFGILLGFVAGVYLAEHVRLGTWPQARESTWVALRATGFSIVIELTAAMLASAVWLVAVIANA